MCEFPKCSREAVTAMCEYHAKVRVATAWAPGGEGR